MDGWTCPRCGADNESWRRFCRSCPTARENQPESTGTEESARVAHGIDVDVAGAVSVRHDRVPVWVAVGVIVVIVVVGGIGYVLVRPRSGRTAAAVASTTGVESTSGAASSSAASSSSARTAGLSTLAPEDLPPGWTEHSTAVTGTDESACVVDLGDTKVITSNALRVFTPPDRSGLSVTSIAAIFVSSSAASDVLVHTMDGTVETCVRDQLSRPLDASGTTATEVSAQTSAVRDGAGTVLHYTLQHDGQSVALEQQLVVFVHDNRLAILTLTAISGSFPTHLRDQLITSAQHRLG